jgi:glycosyltransferase involved in cell wall biosynthesis
MVMIEAMAAGVPVVAANNTAMPEIVKDGENGLLFATENPLDLANKINLLLVNDRLKDQLISNSAVDIAEKYNWKNIVAKLNKIYLEVLGK